MTVTGRGGRARSHHGGRGGGVHLVGRDGRREEDRGVPWWQASESSPSDSSCPTNAYYPVQGPLPPGKGQPPSTTPQAFFDVYAKGHSKGVFESGCQAFQAGYQSGHKDGYEAGWKAGLEVGQKRAESSDDHVDRGGKNNNNNKGGDNWAEWRKRYKPADETKLPLYYACTGKDQYENYPEEIQEALRELGALDTEESHEIEYDMTDGWLFKIRLFKASEGPAWEEIFATGKFKDGWIGAQWDANKATKKPPEEFDSHKVVKYRPVYCKLD